MVIIIYRDRGSLPINLQRAIPPLLPPPFHDLALHTDQRSFCSGNRQPIVSVLPLSSRKWALPYASNIPRTILAVFSFYSFSIEEKKSTNGKIPSLSPLFPSVFFLFSLTRTRRSVNVDRNYVATRSPGTRGVRTAYLPPRSSVTLLKATQFRLRWSVLSSSGIYHLNRVSSPSNFRSSSPASRQPRLSCVRIQEKNKKKNLQRKTSKEKKRNVKEV